MVKEPLLYGVTLFLGVAIGATMEAGTFLEIQTLKVLGLGFLAICFDTVAGIMLGKLMYFLSKGKISPLIGACGISAFPLSAQVVQLVSRRYNPLDMKKWLLSPAMTVNTGGQICSVIVASILLSIVLTGVGM
jgi:oxaloacetate decarboxylase beta subunit